MTWSTPCKCCCASVNMLCSQRDMLLLCIRVECVHSCSIWFKGGWLTKWDVFVCLLSFRLLGIHTKQPSSSVYSNTSCSRNKVVQLNREHNNVILMTRRYSWFSIFTPGYEIRCVSFRKQDFSIKGTSVFS